jgi:hypothetical protein
MALTQAEIEAALKRVLANGETWEMGDIRSHLSLERLLELYNQNVQNADAVSFDLATFGTPSSEA